jgi:signal transduction histidine kinase
VRLSLKAKQVAGVTTIVALALVAVNAVYLTRIANISLEESKSRGELLARTVYQAATQAASAEATASSLQANAGIRVLVEAGMAFSANVTYVAITDTSGTALVHSSPVLVGERVPQAEELAAVIEAGTLSQLRAIYSDRTFEVREKLLAGAPDATPREFGAIRVGLSMLLVRENLRKAMAPTLWALLVAVAVSLMTATAFAQWLLRPIHVLSGGLTRLRRGEFGVRLDLPGGDEFGDLGASFNTLAAELSEARSTLAEHPARLESVVDRLEDAVAIVGTGGEVMFANSSMRELLGPAPAGAPLAEGHPLRPLLARAIESRGTEGPVSLSLPLPSGGSADFLVTVHAFADRQGRYIGAMLKARNMVYHTQVQSSLRYSRKVAALGRLLAGVAHEVKNPLNAMTIHLELLKQKLGAAGTGPRPAAGPGSGHGGSEPSGAMKHVTVIAGEIRRLDTAVQGFLKFSRPEELAPRAVALRPLCDEIARVIEPEARVQRVSVENACGQDVPPVYADPAMLQQAVLNLALNAVQAMPDGGTLRFATRRGPVRTVQLSVSDTGVGIPPDHLARIFDLYFTTKEGGTGLGLSMVYRTVHLHDGTIEVESTPGRGTEFRIELPQA